MQSKPLYPRTRFFNIFSEPYGLPITSGMKYLVSSHSVLDMLILPAHILIPLRCIATRLLHSEDSVIIEYGSDRGEPIFFGEVFVDVNPYWPNELLGSLRYLSNLYIFLLSSSKKAN